MSAALQQSPQFQLKLSVVKGPHTGQVFQLQKEITRQFDGRADDATTPLSIAVFA